MTGDQAQLEIVWRIRKDLKKGKETLEAPSKPTRSDKQKGVIGKRKKSSRDFEPHIRKRTKTGPLTRKKKRVVKPEMMRVDAISRRKSPGEHEFVIAPDSTGARGRPGLLSTERAQNGVEAPPAPRQSDDVLELFFAKEELEGLGEGREPTRERQHRGATWVGSNGRNLPSDVVDEKTVRWAKEEGTNTPQLNMGR